MEKLKNQETKRADRWKTILSDLTLFAFPPTLVVCNMMWLFFMIMENKRLERVFLYSMLALIGALVVACIIFFSYLKTFKKRLNEPSTEHTQMPFLDNKDRNYSALRQYSKIISIIYLATLLCFLFLLIILPENLAERVAPWTLILGAIAMPLCCIIFGRKYFHADDNYWLHIETDYNKFKTWEKYWAHVLASDRLGTCFALVMSIHVLQYDLPTFLTETQYWYFEQIDSAALLLFIGLIVWEVMNLRRHHKEVVESVPKVNNTVQNFYAFSGALAVFVSPIIHIFVVKCLPEQTAQSINLIVSLVISVALIGGAIYFRVYASRYIKASKLTW